MTITLRFTLNGKKICLGQQEGPAEESVIGLDTVAGVDLKAGINTLVFTVVNEEGFWTGSVRFTDAAASRSRESTSR